MTAYLGPSKQKRLIDVDVRTARKEHPCQYCDNPIRPSERYTRLVIRVEDGTRDGRIEIIKFHTPGS